MRKTLDKIYHGAEILGAVSLAMVGVMILSQIVGRQFERQIPSADEMAGYFMAASGFLLLGPALRNGVHIRVGLVIERLSGTPRRLFEILSLSIGLFLAAFLGWFWARLTWDSWDLGEMSQGLLAIPLWLPQGVMGLGLLVLVLALVDELVRVLMGHEASYNLAGPAAEG